MRIPRGVHVQGYYAAGGPGGPVALKDKNGGAVELGAGQRLVILSLDGVSAAELGVYQPDPDGSGAVVAFALPPGTATVWDGSSLSTVPAQTPFYASFPNGFWLKKIVTPGVGNLEVQSGGTVNMVLTGVVINI